MQDNAQKPEVKNTNKISEITIMRVLAMLMIIAFHSLCFYGGRWVDIGAIEIPFWKNFMLYLDAIDLNMFVFISGYLFGFLHLYKDKYRDNMLVLKNKSFRLLLPYVFWGILMVMFSPVSFSWKQLLYGISHLWFLLMLFGVFFLAIIASLLKVERLGYFAEAVVLLVTFCVWYCWNYYGICWFLCIDKVLYYFTAFLFGYFCATKKVVKHSGIKTIPLLIVSLLLLAGLIWLKPDIPNFIERLSSSFLAYIICFSFLIIFSRVHLKGLVWRIVVNVEKWSMGIYIFNQMVMDLVLTNPVCNEWFRLHWQIGPLLLFLIGFFLPMLLASIFCRFRWLTWAIGG